MVPRSQRAPRHIAHIPDGNRRWAQRRGLEKELDDASGVDPRFALYEQVRALGIEDVTVDGFTQDDTNRPAHQVRAFQDACVTFAQAMRRGAARVGQLEGAPGPAALPGAKEG